MFDVALSLPQPREAERKFFASFFQKRSSFCLFFNQKLVTIEAIMSQRQKIPQF